MSHHASLLAVHLLLRMSVLGKSLLAPRHLLLVTESWREMVRVLQGRISDMTLQGSKNTRKIDEQQNNGIEVNFIFHSLCKSRHALIFDNDIKN